MAKTDGGGSKSKTRNPDRRSGKAWSKHTGNTAKSTPNASDQARYDRVAGEAAVRREVARGRTGQVGPNDQPRRVTWESFGNAVGSESREKRAFRAR